MSRDTRSAPSNSGLIRPLAILLMVIGAAGFVAARVLLGEQVLCMLGSTLIVFAGLGLIVWARRNPTDEQRTVPLRSTPARQRWEPLEHLEVPEEIAPSSDLPVEVEPEPVYEPQPQVEEDLHNHQASLADFVIDTFQRQGASVTVETRRPERSILRVMPGGGETRVAIVHEGDGAVDVSDLRALLALVSNHNSSLGYYITDGYFTHRAAEWAATRPLCLVQKGQYDRLTVE